MVLTAGLLSIRAVDRPPRGSTVVLALDGVRDPQNIGSLIRSAYFLGASSVVLSSNLSALAAPIISKASASVLEAWAAVFHAAKFSEFLGNAKESGCAIVGATVGATVGTTVSTTVTATVGASASPLPLCALRGLGRPCVLVVGSEGDGLSRRTKALLTHSVAIPRSSTVPLDVDSLNVSVAGALLLHELLRPS